MKSGLRLTNTLGRGRHADNNRRRHRSRHLLWNRDGDAELSNDLEVHGLGLENDHPVTVVHL